MIGAVAYFHRCELAAGDRLLQTQGRHATSHLPSRHPTPPTSRVGPGRSGRFQRGLNRRDAGSRRLACAGPRTTPAVKQSLRRLARDLRRNLSFFPALGHGGPKVVNKPLQLVDVAPEVLGHAPSRSALWVDRSHMRVYTNLRNLFGGEVSCCNVFPRPCSAPSRPGMACQVTGTTASESFMGSSSPKDLTS